MLKYYIIIFLSIILILPSCGTLKLAGDKTESEKEMSDKEYLEGYSKKLGIQLEGNENPLLIKTIAEWIGVPHKMGGCDKSGTDCSCLTRNLFTTVYNKSLDRSSSAQFENNCKTISKKELKEGDLVFFKISGGKISHVGLYIKDQKFVHASTKKGVIISDLNEAYYLKYFFSAGRVK